MNSELLERIELNPSGAPVATVIWLHGLGADGHDFEPIVPELDLPDTLPIRYVFPHAPHRSVTINAGMVMRAWFDILDVNLNHQLDIANFIESAGQLEALIENERKNAIECVNCRYEISKLSLSLRILEDRNDIVTIE